MKKDSPYNLNVFGRELKKLKRKGGGGILSREYYEDNDTGFVYDYYLEDKEPPRDMIEIAKECILHRTQSETDPDRLDVFVDIALDEWGTWVGRAFNKALEELDLLGEEEFDLDE